MAIINLQLIAQQSYKITTNINKIATDLVGMDCIWSRLLPQENGEDVIVQEYTLHSYDCPKTLKVVTTNASYLAGDFTIDALGIHSVAPLEINIDIAEWEKVYGKDTMPLQGDFVLVQILNKPFEVKTSSIIHSTGEIPVSYRCQLTEWRHNASRKEPIDFTIDFDKISDSLDRLFGEKISKEVADAVVEVETSYDTTTYTDPIKTFDIDSIVVEDIQGKNGNIFANSYYDFNAANMNITYDIQAIYDTNVKENHWIATCWFKSSTENLVDSKGVKLGKLAKEKDYWYIEVLSNMRIKYGDIVTISRGTFVQLDGEIVLYGCDKEYCIKIASSDCLIANKKLPNWWQSGIWKISKYINYNILTGYNSEDITFKIDVDANNVIIRTNKTITKIPFENASMYINWHYLVVDISPTKIHVILIENKEDEKTYKFIESKKIIADKLVNTNNFEVNKICIENAYKDFCMTNIRLYENEKAIGNTYKQDMYSQVTRNASKLILVDTPRPANKQSFVSHIR